MSREHQEHEHDREHDQDDARQKPRPKVGYPRRVGADNVFKKGSEKTAKRVAQLISTVDRHTVLLTSRLNANDVHADEVDQMRSAVEQERTALLTLIGNLPSSDPLVVKALEASDRISVVIKRLDALGRAYRGREATQEDRGSGEKSEQIKKAEAENPPGYCDIAPQGSAPCELDHQTRGRLRERLTDSVVKARENYKQAVNALHLTSLLAPVPPSMEQQIGSLIFSVLFSVVGKAAEFAVSKGVDKAAEKLTKETWDYGKFYRKDGPEKDSIAIANAVGNKAVETIFDKAKEGKRTEPQAPRSGEGITAKQLSESAQLAVAVPANKTAFLESLKTAPDAWADNILDNRDNLLDEDLAALVNALPLASPSITQAAFEAKIRDMIARFQSQVLAVDTAPGTNIRPIQIHWNGKTRMALVAAEKAPNKNMHGEWKHVPVKTGKWTFLRWLDDDMKDMAQARVREEEGVWATPFMAMANDAEFWDNKTLELLAQESAR